MSFVVLQNVQRSGYIPVHSKSDKNLKKCGKEIRSAEILKAPDYLTNITR
jgi:hypothetical protein